jgi:hypothetical protein
MFPNIIRSMERVAVMKNILPGWGRNLNLLFAVSTVVYCVKVFCCSRTKLGLIRSIQM